MEFVLRSRRGFKKEILYNSIMKESKKELFGEEEFDRMYYDVMNGVSKKELVNWYGEENVKLYLDYGYKNDLFEGDLEG